MLSRDQILTADDIETREVDVPEWGGTVRLKSLTGRERDAFEASNRILRGKEFVPNPVDIRARLVIRALVDETGNRLFKDTEAGALGAKSGAVLDRLYDIVAEMSGMTSSPPRTLRETPSPTRATVLPPTCPRPRMHRRKTPEPDQLP